MKKTVRYIITSILLFVVLLIVWQFSQQSGESSNNLSSDLTNDIIHFFNYLHLGGVVQKFLYYIDLRKVAHVLIFSGIGFLMMLLIPVKKAVSRACIALGLAILFGVVDELHQAFSSDRIASWTDVLIDFLGAVLGIAVAIFGRWIYLRIKDKKRHEKN